MAPQERRLADDRHPLRGGDAQLGELALEVAGLLQRRGGQHPVAAAQGGDDVAQGRRDVAHHAGRLGTGTPDGGGGGDGPDEQGHDAADDRVEPARHGALLGGDERDDEDRLDPGLDDEELAGRQHDRDPHGEHDDQGQLPGAVAEHEDDDVTDEHPDGDADRHLDDPAQPLPVGEAEAQDGRDGGEEGHRVAEDVLGHEPGRQDGDADLGDEHPALAQPAQSALQARAQGVGGHGPVRRTRSACSPGRVAP